MIELHEKHKLGPFIRDYLLPHVVYHQLRLTVLKRGNCL